MLLTIVVSRLLGHNLLKKHSDARGRDASAGTDNCAHYGEDANNMAASTRDLSYELSKSDTAMNNTKSLQTKAVA